MLREQMVVSRRAHALVAAAVRAGVVIGLMATCWPSPGVTLVVTPIGRRRVRTALWVGCPRSGRPGGGPGPARRVRSPPGRRPRLRCGRAPRAWRRLAAGRRCPGACACWACPSCCRCCCGRPGGRRRDLRAVGRGRRPGQRRARADRHAQLVYDAGPAYGRTPMRGSAFWSPCWRAAGNATPWSSATWTRITPAARPPCCACRGGAPPQLAGRQPPVAGPAPPDLAAGQRWTWAAEFAILHPATSDLPPRRRPPHALSCVLRISDAHASVLLAGDIRSAQEALLARTGAAGRPAAVPHHSSKTSSSKAFLDAVRPLLALVQAGYRNRLRPSRGGGGGRYRVRAIALEISPHCGAATWTSTRPGRVRCGWQSAPALLAPPRRAAGFARRIGLSAPSQRPGSCYPVFRGTAPMLKFDEMFAQLPGDGPVQFQTQSWGACRSRGCRACATITGPMPNGWAASRRR